MQRKTVTTHTLDLQGDSYNIGRRLGEIYAESPKLAKLHTSPFPGFQEKDFTQARTMFSRWCPGLNEELAGFADALHVPLAHIFYYAMTYLHPNCSQLSVLPSRTKNGHPLLARSYEFSDEMEEFTLIKTSVNRKYSHIGTSAVTFGREEGLNSEGLAVTMSSCGLPVGAHPQMRRPALAGLQYWAVIRTLLENCRDVKEALSFLKEMPIAYNLNMILADASGHMALVETLDGRFAAKEISDDVPGSPTYLHATNHACLDELSHAEPQAMEHSLIRYQFMDSFMKSPDTGDGIDPEILKELLLSPYPNGLCCHYYEDFFGTTKSLVLDPADGSLELCWGGCAENGWRRYLISEPLREETGSIELTMEMAPKDIFAFRPI